MDIKKVLPYTRCEKEMNETVQATLEEAKEDTRRIRHYSCDARCTPFYKMFQSRETEDTLTITCPNCKSNATLYVMKDNSATGFMKYKSQGLCPQYYNAQGNPIGNKFCKHRDK